MNPIDGFDLTPQYGWICPRCNAVMAPWQGWCLNCKSQTATVQSTLSPKAEWTPVTFDTAHVSQSTTFTGDKKE